MKTKANPTAGIAAKNMSLSSPKNRSQLNITTPKFR
ncbi:Uncharacterised protein [Vibrio cholerae]|nr:Uncharacterised protein [Vibrio cholerae]